MGSDGEQGIEACPVDHQTREKWLEAAKANGQQAPPHPVSRPKAPVSERVLPDGSFIYPVRYSLDKGRWDAIRVQRRTARSNQLDTEREISTIPRAITSANAATLNHAERAALPANSERDTGRDEKTGNWVYPSQEMFFNAMQRKGHEADPADMSSIVPIHNAVNERAWAEIKTWEAGQGSEKCGGPKLVSFAGDSKALTPRARWKVLTGYHPPFDRHDWVIDRCGRRIDYVIDFYSGKGGEGLKGLNFYLDVRPKLNSLEGIRMRMVHAATMADPPKPAGMSLYADLLEPEKKSASTAVIASAPVRYNMKAQEAPTGDSKKKDGAYQIPAYLRPQIQSMKAKAAQPTTPRNLSNVAPTTVASSSPAKGDALSAKAPALNQKSKFEDWVGQEGEEITYQRPNWNRQKKNKRKKEQSRVWTWNDIYDPSLPNNYADYKGSEEQFAEIRDWKARLYYHQLKEINRETKQQKQEVEKSEPRNLSFAPPPNLNFAPPSFDDNPVRRASIGSSDDGYQPTRVTQEKSLASARPISFAPPSLDETPARRPIGASHNSYSSANPRPTGSPQAKSLASTGPVSFAPSTQSYDVSSESLLGNTDAPPAAPAKTPEVQKPDVRVDEDYRASALAKAAAIKAKLDASIKAAKTPVPAAPTPTIAAPATTAIATTPVGETTDIATSLPSSPVDPPVSEDKDSATISHAPVRYTQAPAESSLETQATDQPPQLTSRPGQKNFAERYMQKFGYEKGKGLGAQGEGIVTPIIMKAEKRKKRSDAEGGGWAVPANMGKIVGGKKRKLDGVQEDETEMSPVVKITGMVNGLDIDYEMQENNLMQRIGDTLSQDHGNIERIFIWRQAMGGDDAVFVKFNSAVSALGAVNRSGGITFANNAVTAVFFDAERFDKGEYI